MVNVLIKSDLPNNERCYLELLNNTKSHGDTINHRIKHLIPALNVKSQENQGMVAQIWLNTTEGEKDYSNTSPINTKGRTI